MIRITNPRLPVEVYRRALPSVDFAHGYQSNIRDLFIVELNEEEAADIDDALAKEIGWEDGDWSDGDLGGDEDSDASEGQSKVSDDSD
jgi:hypothetical protein